MSAEDSIIPIGGETMSTMDAKQYLLDGEPISAREIIRRARTEGGYGVGEFILTTSGAAETLRGQGHEVCENPDYKDGL
jgi:hypothetical protein